MKGIFLLLAVMMIAAVAMAGPDKTSAAHLLNTAAKKNNTGYYVLRGGAKPGSLEHALERAIRLGLAGAGFHCAPKASADVLVSVKLLPGEEGPASESTALILLKDAKSQRLLWVGGTQVNVRTHEHGAAAKEAAARIIRGVPTV